MTTSMKQASVAAAWNAMNKQRISLIFITTPKFFLFLFHDETNIIKT